MRSLHINHSLQLGGAAIAAERTMQALARCQTGVCALTAVRAPGAELLRRWPLEAWFGKLWWHLGYADRHLLSTYSLRWHPAIQRSDIIHLHNLHGGYFNWRALPFIARSKPVVWTLHDMWPLTGHCAYSAPCDQFMRGCGECPDLTQYPYMHRDKTRQELAAKRRINRQINIQYVSPSHWLAGQLLKSQMSEQPVCVIPYPIDCEVHAPGNGLELRQRLTIAPDDFVIAMSAHKWTDPRKSGRLLLQAVAKFAAQRAAGGRMHLLVLGAEAPQCALDGVSVHVSGYLASDEQRVAWLRAADVFVFASMADNLPLVIQEAMSCGLPVIANPVGGVSDMVTHGQTGLLVDQVTTDAYAHALQLLESNAELRGKLSTQARTFAASNWDMPVIGRRMSALYSELLNSSARS
jgi:glycosyltransferase involved in cell wall biosynthesis